MFRDSSAWPLLARGRRPTANFRRTSSSTSTCSARPTICAGSPLGIVSRRRSWAISSISHVSVLAVNITRYRSGDSGWTSGGGGDETGDAGLEPDDGTAAAVIGSAVGHADDVKPDVASHIVPGRLPMEQGAS